MTPAELELENLRPKQKTKTAEERFWEKVDKSGGDDACWIWTASTDGRYGVFWFDGKRIRATRYSWQMANGVPFPPDKDACHTCDNPRCVNPKHIWPGTPSENALDAVAKGRLVNAGRKRINKKTHCLLGHEFTEENTILNGQGKRLCRICRHMRYVKYWEQDKAKRIARGETVKDCPDKYGWFRTQGKENVTG